MSRKLYSSSRIHLHLQYQLADSFLKMSYK
uniref:Uncharacterized protein n=1 Tax=Siphoviridae sp. ctB3v5 TaxID=2826186 RepID=A0A8S5M8Q2_9CAUD|nr:MAG TPA: hypothetical protein [Siphoviridae sp. ctB3v5]